MELSTALTGAKGAFDLLQGAIRARDDAKIQAATLELREKLFAMSDIAMAYVERNAALVSRNAQLELTSAEQARAIAKLEDKAAERARYALHEIRPGAFVYAFVPTAGADARPAHYLCQPCYDRGIRAVLRHVAPGKGYSERWVCSEGGGPHIVTLPGTALPQDPPIRSAGHFGRQW